MNINNISDFDENNMRLIKPLDDYNRYDERDYEEKWLKIKKEEVRKEAIRRMQEGI